MFHAVRNTFLAAAAAVTLGLLGGAAQAATISIADGSTTPIEFGNIYTFEKLVGSPPAGEGPLTSGPGKFTFNFTTATLPKTLAAITGNVASFGADIQGLYFSLTRDGVETFATFRITDNGLFGIDFDATISQAFDDTMEQTLTLGWDSYDARNGSLQFSIAVAAVPLPAGGLLLIGALGGLAVLRRRKAVAA